MDDSQAFHEDRWRRAVFGRCLLIAFAFIASVWLWARDPAYAQVAAESPWTALVEQLGDNSYARRIDAADRLVAAKGEATSALQAGLAHADPEIRRACRRILSDVYDAEQAAALAAFRAGIVTDAGSEVGYGLPGWEDYRAAIGNDAAARELFAEMQSSEPGLMASLVEDEQTVAAAFSARFQQVAAPMFRPGAGFRNSSSLGTTATLLFIGASERFELPSDTLASAAWSGLVRQEDFQRVLTEGPMRPHARKLLGLWVLRPSDESQLQQKLLLAYQFELPEGLALAVETASNEELHGYYRVYAVHAIGRIGGAAHAARLAPLLNDEAVCGQRVRAGRDNDDPAPVQMRDVALAWLIHLTGQMHSDYELPQATEVFANLDDSAYVNTQNLGFDNPARREAALKKWRDYAAGHPLAEPPKVEERAAPGDEQASEGKPTLFNLGRAIGLGNRFGAGKVNPAVRKQGPGAQPGTDPDSPIAAGGLPPARRELVQQLARAEEAIGAGDYSEAAQLLAAVLAEPTDCIYAPDRQSPVSRSIKTAAEGLLAAMPPAGWRSYELQSGPEAALLLGKAVETGSDDLLKDIARRYYFTKAGAEAVHLLAAQHQSHGRPLQAAQLWDRLRAQSPHAGALEPALSLNLSSAWRLAGRLTESEHAWQRGAALRGARRIAIAGGQREAPSADAQALWLEKILGLPRGESATPQWPLFRKDAAQSGVAPAGAPFLAPQFTLAVAEDDRVAVALDLLAASRRKRNEPLLPAGQPLLVGDSLLIRTAVDTRAVDVNTGELKWRSELDDALRHLARSASGEEWTQRAQFVERGLSRRLWDDAAFGQINSDGRLVFGLEGSPFALAGEYQRLVVDGDGRRRLEIDAWRDHNRLAAYDVVTGKLAWEVGGPAPEAPIVEGDPFDENADPFAEPEAFIDDSLRDDLAGVYFLSPPLPWADRLYVVGRRGRKSRLLELDPNSGRLVSSMLLYENPHEQPDRTDALAIAMASQGVALPPIRGAAAPAAASGVIVCPLSDELFAAVDVAAHRFLWLYRGDAGADPAGRLTAAEVRLGVGRAPRQSQEGWTESSATIAGDRVILAPAGEDQLHCLRLGDGKILWSAPRRDGFYVGGVANERVAIIGRSRLAALSLDTGEPLWTNEVGSYGAGAVPVGRGYITPDHYHAPLSTGEVAAFDLKSGAIVARTRPRNDAEGRGALLGNLVRERDLVVSQGATSIDRYETLAARRERLAAAAESAPSDRENLLALAETLRNEGLLSEAMQQWRRAEALGSSDEEGRELLASVIVEGLERDFDAFLTAAVEFESLLAGSDRRFDLWKQLAAGYERRGEFAVAAEHYLKLAEDDRSATQRAEAQRDAGLEAAAPQLEVRRERWLLARLTEIHARAGADERTSIERLVAERFPEGWPAALSLGNGPLAPPDRQLAFSRALLAKGKQLEAQPLLLSVYGGGDAARQAEAIALLAETAGGKDALSSAGLSPGSDAEAPWPRGAVDVDREHQSEEAGPRIPVAVSVGDEPIAAQWLELDWSTRAAVGKDRFGVELWKTSLPPHDNQAGAARLETAQAMQLGSVVVIADGQSVYGIDARVKPPEAQQEPRTLWQFNAKVAPTRAEARMRMRILGARANIEPRQGRRERLARAGGAVFFQQDDAVLAVEAATGKVQWRLANAALDCDLLAEGDVLLVTAPDAEESMAVAAIDGRELGRRPAAPLQGRLAVRGRKLLLWSDADRGATLRLFDPWTGKDMWRTEHDARSRVDAIERTNEAAILAPSGRLTMVELDTGKTVLETGVEPSPECEGITVLRDAQQYILAIRERSPNAHQAMMMGGAFWAGAVPVNGYVAGIDPASGKRKWAVKASDQLLYVDRPTELPVLAMVARKAVTQGEDQEPTWPTQVLVVDRRNGRVLHDETGEERANLYEIASQPDQNSIELRMDGAGLKLTFTDRPVKKPAR